VLRLCRIVPLFVSAAGSVGSLAAFDTPKTLWPQLLTSHGQPLNIAGSIREAIDGSIDFLITGIPMGDAELRQVYKARGVNLIHVATAVTAAVPCYNLSGIDAPLRFSAETLSRIFLGHIRKWNDPALAALNPTIKLPDLDIVVIGHTGEDGSTYAWTDYLSKTNREWRNTVGSVRALLKPAALARGQSEDDVAALVRQTPNSISYVELWSARNHKLQIGRVRNRSGRDIEPSTESMSAAAMTATPEMLGDIRSSITDTRGADDYPISVLTWVVVPDSAPDSEKRRLVLSFLKWILTEGQGAPASTFHGRLPQSVITRELDVIESLR
jgi:phosphate transport system substrate-binding protein